MFAVTYPNGFTTHVKGATVISAYARNNGWVAVDSLDRDDMPIVMLYQGSTHVATAQYIQR